MMSTYVDKSAQIAVTSNVSSNCVIQANTQIDSKANILQSIIGEACQIGQNAVIKNSLIDKNVKVGAGCVIENAIIQSGVIVQDGCKIESGTFIAENVVVKQGVTIPSGSICSLLNYNAEEKQFKPIEEDQSNQDYFVKGIIAYVPRDMTLTKQEHLGASTHQPAEESDLDISDEDSEVDPF